MAALVAVAWGRAKSIQQCLPKHFAQMVTVLLAGQETISPTYQIAVVQSFVFLQLFKFVRAQRVFHVAQRLAFNLTDARL